MTGTPLAPFTETPTGVTLSLRVTPNASRNAIEGIETLADDSTVLRVRVTAAPDKGRANKAVITLLAKSLGVPKSGITVKSGETARRKTIEIAGDPATLGAKITALADKSP